MCLSAADGRYLLMASRHGQIALCDSYTWETLNLFNGPSDMRIAALSDDGRLVLSGGDLARITPQQESVAEDPALALKWAYMPPLARQTIFEVESENRQLAAGAVCLWDADTGQCLRIFKIQQQPTSACLSADGHLALIGSWHELSLWDVHSGHSLRTIHLRELATATIPRSIKQVRLSPDGRLALAASHNSIHLLDMDTDQQVHIFQKHQGIVTAICFSPDGRWFLSGDHQGTCQLWNVRTGACLYTFKGIAPVSALTFSPDGNWFIAGYGDASMQLWELDWELEASDHV
jgi:WD40 repeat protein